MKDSEKQSREVWPDGPQWLYRLADLQNILMYLRKEQQLAKSIKQEVHQ